MSRLPESMRHLTRLFLILSYCLAASFAVAGDGAYLHELVEESRRQMLAQQREWLDLVHYRPRLFGGFRSLADNPAFFAAPDGKDNPQSELEATLAAFFSASPDDGQQHPQCRYIARYQWLKKRLAFDPARLPEQECPRFDAWYRAVASNQITLIFPTAYLNNPSSMFGHTLLRVDPEGQSEKTRLFSYAINFAAETTETNGVIFAVKGLLGGYPGYFSTTPYYEKVKEYNSLESRDIWEYELNLRPDEVRRLLEHAWELGQVNFDYYFFDENCSYQLLALLDVARPGMGLADRFDWWAIPSDTVREVLAQEGLLRNAVFRPSNATIIKHRSSLLLPEEQALARALAKNAVEIDAALSELPEHRQAQVLELANYYIQSLWAKDELTREEATSRSLKVLTRRSRLSSRTDVPPVPLPPLRPDQGHDTARFAFGAGAWDDDVFTELRMRPAYHDLLDPPGGYVPGAQINFLEAALRYYPETDHAALHAFRVLDIFSISPRDDFFKPLSWKISVGAERMSVFFTDTRTMYGKINGGIGPAYALGKATVYAMLEGTLLANGSLPHDAAAAAGMSTGILAYHNRFTLHAMGRVQRYGSGLDVTVKDAELGVGFQLSSRLSLQLAVSQSHVADYNRITEGSLRLNFYF